MKFPEDCGFAVTSANALFTAPAESPTKSRFLFICTEMNEQRRDVLQLDLFERRERGYSIKILMTNKRCGARKLVSFHEGCGAQEGIFRQFNNQEKTNYIPARGWNANKVYMLANLLAHNLTHELQIRRSETRRSKTENRRTLWLFKTCPSLRRNLRHKAARMNRPNGKWTQTFNGNAAVERLLPSLMPPGRRFVKQLHLL